MYQTFVRRVNFIFKDELRTSFCNSDSPFIIRWRNCLFRFVLSMVMPAAGAAELYRISIIVSHDIHQLLMDVCDGFCDTSDDGTTAGEKRPKNKKTTIITAISRGQGAYNCIFSVHRLSSAAELCEMFCNCHRCDTSIKHINPLRLVAVVACHGREFSDRIDKSPRSEKKKKKNPGTFSFILFAFIPRVNLPSPLHPFDLTREKMAKEQQLRSIC